MYRTQRWAEGLSGEFSSTFECVDDFCREVQDMFLKQTEGSERFAVMLILREAVNNAVVHGSLKSPEKRVSCEVTREGAWLTISVLDEGSGFAWPEWLKRACNSDKPNLGLCIMKSLANEVKFNDSGNRITLRKKILSWEEQK